MVKVRNLKGVVTMSAVLHLHFAAAFPDEILSIHRYRASLKG